MAKTEDFVRPMYRWIKTRKNVRGNCGKEMLFLLGGLSFKVLNRSSDKKLIVRFSIFREDGAIEQYNVFPEYRRNVSDYFEEWTTTELPIFPLDSPHGKMVRASFSTIIHYGDSPLFPAYEFHFADLNELLNNKLKWAFRATAYTDNRPFTIPETELSRAAYNIYNTPLYANVRFTRETLGSQYHPATEIHSLLDRVEQNTLNNPHLSHYVHLSVFNFDNTDIINHLLHLHSQGVNIECIGGWEQLSSSDWSENVARLRKAGIPVLGVVRNTPFDPGSGIASMHTKFIIFDGFAVMSASYNLDFQNWQTNRENGLFYYNSDIALLYEHNFQTIKGSPFQPYTIEPGEKYNLYYSFGRYKTPRGEVLDWRDAVANEIYNAQERIYIVMFDMTDFNFSSQITMYDMLIDAVCRGVEVHIVLNGFKCRDSDVFEKDIPKKEFRLLMQNGVKISLLFNKHDIYSPLHHKFVVIDNETVIAESANWYIATLYSDEVFSIIRDKQCARSYMEELMLLMKYYRVTTF